MIQRALRRRRKPGQSESLLRAARPLEAAQSSKPSWSTTFLRVARPSCCVWHDPSLFPARPSCGQRDPTSGPSDPSLLPAQLSFGPIDSTRLSISRISACYKTTRTTVSGTTVSILVCDCIKRTTVSHTYHISHITYDRIKRTTVSNVRPYHIMYRTHSPSGSRNSQVVRGWRVEGG